MTEKLKEIEEIFKNFPKGIECNEMKSQRIRGRDEERERVLKIITETLDYFDDIRGGMINRVSILDFINELNRRIENE